jgi:hypothetical protein
VYDSLNQTGSGLIVTANRTVRYSPTKDIDCEPTRMASASQLRTLNRLRAEALDDLAIGIDASLSGQIDGPVWSVSDRGTAGALDRVAQIADRKYCRPHARPFLLRFARPLWHHSIF